MAGSAVLLPVRLETRFDDVDGTTRMRLIVVPDRCWFDRHHGATDAELDLLAEAVRTAGGALVAGQAVPEGERAQAAFDGLAGSVGAGRALWLARSFPPMPGARSPHDIDRDAGPRDAAPQRTVIHGLPSRIEVVADVSTGRVSVATLSPRSRLVLTPELVDPARSEVRADDQPDDGDDAGESWWPQWRELVRVGLAVEITPSPVDPNDVVALYVVGVGDVRAGEVGAGEVFRHHLDSGDLGVLRCGQPTNTVAGAPTVDLGLDAEAWRSLASRGPLSRDGQLALAVAGDRAALGAVLGGEVDDHAEALHVSLVDLLFPALAAHDLREHWAAHPDTIRELARWAREHVRPDGPVAPIRIGRQAYAVWPVAPWSQWSGADVDAGIVDIATRVNAALAQLAGERTVGDAGLEELWDLLGRTPTSAGFDLRAGLPLPLVRDIGRVAMGGTRPDEFADRIQAHADEVVTNASDRIAVPIARPWAMRLGLVLPNTVDEGGAELPIGPWSEPEDPDLVNHPAEWVGACCARLLDAFGPVGLTDAAVRLVDGIEWWPASLWWRLTVLSGFIALDQALREEAGDTGPVPDGSDDLAIRVWPEQLGDPDGTTGVIYARFREALQRLIEMSRHHGDGVVAMLERALTGLLDTRSHRVDPWLTGAAWQRLSALQEDRPLGLYGWVDGPLDGEPGPDRAAGAHLTPSYGQARLAAILRDKARRNPEELWDLDVTSARVRAAVRLGDDIRAGAHAAEAVGREVERLIGERAVIDRVRREFSVRVEHAGRRTCDGLAVVRSATDEPARLAALGVGTVAVDAIAGIEATIDTYADLLVAEAVDHAVDGRSASAAQALDAAAGLGMPPQLDALSTPSRGRSVRTTVLTVLPATRSAPGERSPIACANPGLASWVASGLAGVGTDTGAPEWTCAVDGDPGITFLELGLHLADALVFDDMAGVVRLALDLPPSVAVAEPPAIRALRAQAPVLGARVPNSQDVGLGGGAAGAAAAAVRFDRAVAFSMLRRLAALRLAARRLVRRLHIAASDAARRSALVDAARWGIAPPVAPVDGPALRAATDAAARAMADRIASASNVDTSDASSVSEHIRRLVGRAIPLAAEVRSFPVTLTADPVDDDGRPRIDAQWLEIVAAVRPSLARLDAAQHIRVASGSQPFAAACTHPGQPWRTPGPSDGAHAVPHLIVAYGPGPLALTAGAWGVLDSFGETVPTTGRDAGLALRFNAPSSQPPNAILVAVTPDDGGEMDDRVALEAVVEARRTARSRMVRQEDLGQLGFLSGPWLPAFESGGFQWRDRSTTDDWQTGGS